MKRIASYYFILRCIDSSKTVEQIESCERMINNMTGFLGLSWLAEKALFKKVELLTNRYSIE
jgi:hypothetical protein